MLPLPRGPQDDAGPQMPLRTQSLLRLCGRGVHPTNARKVFERRRRSSGCLAVPDIIISSSSTSPSHPNRFRSHAREQTNKNKPSTSRNLLQTQLKFQLISPPSNHRHFSTSYIISTSPKPTASTDANAESAAPDRANIRPPSPYSKQSLPSSRGARQRPRRNSRRPGQG